MFQSFLAVPLHFTFEFIGFLVCAGGAVLVVSRPSLVPGPRANRVTAALGLGAIAAAEVAHGGAFLLLDSDRVMVGLYAVGLAFLGVALAGAVRPGVPAFLGLNFKHPVALAPAGAALFVAILAAVGAVRSKLPALFRLCAASVLIGASQVLVALGPDAEFGAGPDQAYNYTAHSVRTLGFLVLGWWLWTGVRSSLRVRFVAAFAALLIVVVLVLSSALTGVITNRVEEEELNRTATQLTNELTEITVDDRENLTSTALSIAADDDTQTLLTGNPDPDLLRARTDALLEASSDHDFIVLLDRDGRVVAASGEGPATYRQGQPTNPALSRQQALSIAGSAIARSLQGSAERTSGVARVGNPTPKQPDAVAVLAGVGVQSAGRGQIGAVLVGQFIDARAIATLSEGLDPARATLILDRSAVASELPEEVSTRLRLDRDLVTEIREGDVATRAETIASRSFFNAYSPIPVRPDGDEFVPGAVLGISSPARIVSSTSDEVTRILFLVAMGVAAVVLGLAWLSGRLITRPVASLTAAADAIRHGDLNARAEVRGEDEVGQLGETFNEMTATLARTTNDLREAAREEQRLRSRIETIIQSMADGLVAVGPDRRILAFNPQAEALTGIKSEVAVGKPIDEVIDARTTRGTNVSLPIFDLAGGSMDGVYLVRKSGDFVPVAVDSAVLKDEEGTAVGGVAVFRDMSREREVERMKSEFLSNISHELRTPLTPIKGYAEILESRDLPLPKTKQFASGIIDSTEKLERIIELLVDFSALEAGRLAPRSKPVDIKEMLEELAAEAKTKTTRHEVVVDVKARLPKVVGDERLLRRSLEEIIDNAVKFSPQGGTIRLEAKGATTNGGRARRAVEVSISDEGIGIPPEQLSKIFTDFHQLDGSETRTYGGLGLGLAFVQRIVEAHDGWIDVDSQPQKGTRLTITIPATQRRRSA